LAASLIALLAASGWIISKSELIPHRLTTGLAVLPFENLSDEKEHAFFVDGVQDDILTKLAKIADLKVISRGSVMQYRGKQDIREIGNALGVSHVLEGTVRRFGKKLHVNAQLVDTHTNQDIWADEYDRDLNDVFAIESEVAQSIANRLRAKVSARELAAIQERPTRDLVAYDLYLRAIPLLDWIFASSNPEKDLSAAVDLLHQAVTRDPSFFLAYCRLAEAHDGIYFYTNVDHTSNRLALAKSAIDSAFRLKPDSGEAHLALAMHFYRGYTDYNHARAELALARQSLPNNPKVFHTLALMDRRQGRWPDALRNFQRATELDPRNVVLLTHLAEACAFSRTYNEADNAFARVLAISPHDSDVRLHRAFNALSWRADIGALRAAVGKIRADDPAFVQTDGMKSAMFMLAASDHDFGAASRIAESFPENDPHDDTGLGRKFRQGLLARVKGDAAEASSAFTVARAEVEEAIRGRPDEPKLLCGLGLIDAGLGRKEDALREGRRAVELMPVSKDSLDGPIVLTYFAQICAWTGERDKAIEQLEIAAKIPAGPDYGELRLSPMWDPLRGDPRFEKIAASLAPK
jgi:serine/threonine-protein kinase